MQFQVIVVIDPQTNKHSYKPTNRQDQLQYTARSVNRSRESGAIPVVSKSTVRGTDWYTKQ